MQILSNYENGVWVPIQRGDYTYDDAGNITEEVVSQWNATTKDWDKVQKNAASWDNLNRQTSYAQYAWNGTKWVGSGERKNFEYLNDTSNTYSLNGWSIWDTTAGEWVYFMKREFNWNELGQLTSQVETYFNEDTQKWDGCYDWYNVTKYNKKTIINYDEKHRITSEPYYEAHEIGDYTLMSDIKHVWSDIAEGGSQEVLTSIVYRNNRAPWAENYVLQDSTIKQYNAAGNPTLSEEWHIRGVSGPSIVTRKTRRLTTPTVSSLPSSHTARTVRIPNLGSPSPLPTLPTTPKATRLKRLPRDGRLQKMIGSTTTVSPRNTTTA